MSPRPILKHGSSSHHHSALSAIPPSALPYPPEPHQVHFPPPTALSKTYPTHSVTSYDRAPIVVTRNDCQLPERGCPGRTYDGSPKSRKHLEGRHPHPRASEHSSTHDMGRSRPPPLVPDISSSESDESDGIVSPPCEYNPAVSIPPLNLPSPHHSMAHSQEVLDKALAFLPHAPSPCKEREREKRDRKRRSQNSSVTKFKSEDCARSFAASSLDGCLGGF